MRSMNLSDGDPIQVGGQDAVSTVPAGEPEKTPFLRGMRITIGLSMPCLCFYQ